FAGMTGGCFGWGIEVIPLQIVTYRENVIPTKVGNFHSPPPSRTGPLPQIVTLSVNGFSI
ncbi:MAG: hypothetical protein J7L89_02080, partial [Bacteroidales bacterium]|nr:hypothetical protein [Bacteroidales bacterium]